MAKSILKEIIIILLLLLIIIMLLGILLYDYIPNTKTIPAKVEEYALEQVVQEELNKELDNMESEEIVKTYKLDAVDIEYYEKTNEYNKGKVNPFAVYSEETENTDSNTTGEAGNNNNKNNTTQNPSKDNFLNTTGK